MYDPLVRRPDRTRREYHAENAAVRMPGLAPRGFITTHASEPALSVHLHAGMRWKSCSNSCSAPAGALIWPKTGARFSSFAVPGCSWASFCSPLPTSPHRSSSSCSRSSSSHGCCGASLSTLSDCMTAAKSAWWLLVFYAVPGVLGQLAKGACLQEPLERGCIASWRWQALRSRSGD